MVWSIDAFDIIFAIIFLSGSRRNHSPERLRIYIGRLPGLLAHNTGSFKISRPLSILLHFYGRSTSLLGSFFLEDHAIISKRLNGWSWYWHPKSQALLHLVGHPSCHCSVHWLPSRLSFIELRVPFIAPPLRLAVAFICRASTFFSTPPPLVKKALIYR